MMYKYIAMPYVSKKPQKTYGQRSLEQLIDNDIHLSRYSWVILTNLISNKILNCKLTTHDIKVTVCCSCTSKTR